MNSAERTALRNKPHQYVACPRTDCFDTGKHCDVCGRPELVPIHQEQAQP